MRFQGTVWKFGDDTDTDCIIPARFLTVYDELELARHCFTDVRPGFQDMITQGDIIVAGRNFGFGSSREHAPLAIKGVGISLIVAESFARIFYRNGFNIGLPLVESPEASRALAEGTKVSVDLLAGEIEVFDTGERFSCKPLPDLMRHIIEAGGLVEYVKTKRGHEHVP